MSRDFPAERVRWNKLKQLNHDIDACKEDVIDYLREGKHNAAMQAMERLRELEAELEST